MSEQHIIKEITDLLKLDDEQFARFLPDLVVWRKFCQDMQTMGAEVEHMVWVDDGKPGQIHTVDVRVEETGDLFTLRGSAWEEPKEQP